MKKYCLYLFFFSLSFSTFSQKVIPFVDFNFYFQNFQNGAFSIIDFQRIRDVKAGDDCVAYYDNKSNLVVYNGTEKKNLANLNVDFQVSDHLVAWRIGNTINMWDDGKLRTLSFNGIDYSVKDSIIVYSDSRYNSVNAYWKGEVYPLYTLVDDIYMPTFIGENIVAFKDNGNFYKIFWNGQIYEIGVWNDDIAFNGGTDVLAYNDPTTRSFTVFDKGEFIEVESYFMNKYKAGRGIVVYEDLNGNLNLYKKSSKKQISNFSASMWEVKDEVVLWLENNFLKTIYLGDVKTICNFMPKDFLIKNDVIAYRNVMGGVSTFINGVNTELSNQTNAEYEIYGSSVLVKLFNSSFVVFQNGMKYYK